MPHSLMPDCRQGHSQHSGSRQSQAIIRTTCWAWNRSPHCAVASWRKTSLPPPT
jgi:hypothetical protein